MRPALSVLCISLAVALCGFAAEPQLEVVNRDGSITIDADDVTLGRLLRLWDQATGLRTSIPSHLAKRRISIHFSGLSLNDAVRKIFEEQGFDYVFIEGAGITVTAATRQNTDTGPFDGNVLEAPSDLSVPESHETEIAIEAPSVPVERPSPPIVQTPFGAIMNSGRNQFIQLPPVPGEMPGPPFFARPILPIPPAGAPNGPAQNDLFAPISIYQNPGLPPPVPRR